MGRKGASLGFTVATLGCKGACMGVSWGCFSCRCCRNSACQWRGRGVLGPCCTAGSGGGLLLLFAKVSL